MNTSGVKHKFDTSFLFGWVTAGILGTAVGGSLGVVAGEQLGFPLGQAWSMAAGVPELIRPAASAAIAGLFNGAVVSAAISLAQFAVLRRYLARAIWWLPASFVIPALAPAVSSFFSSAIPAVTGIDRYAWVVFLCGGMLVQSFAGLATGFLEWLVLKGATPRAGWWIGLTPVVDFLSTLIGLPASVACLAFNSVTGRYICNGFASGLGGGTAALLTGLALVWLFAGLGPARGLAAQAPATGP